MSPGAGLPLSTESDSEPCQPSECTLSLQSLCFRSPACLLDCRQALQSESCEVPRGRLLRQFAIQNGGALIAVAGADSCSGTGGVGMTARRGVRGAEQADGPGRTIGQLTSGIRNKQARSDAYSKLRLTKQVRLGSCIEPEDHCIAQARTSLHSRKILEESIFKPRYVCKVYVSKLTGCVV